MCFDIVGDCEEIPVSEIRSSSRPLRHGKGDISELADSIKKFGLLQPVIVRPREKGYEIVAGSRRLEAFRRLRMRKIPCHAIEMDEKDAFEVGLVENVQRQTLDPIEEAEDFKKYVDDYGYGGVSELAKKIGKSQEYVSRRIELLSLPRRVKEELMRRRISSSLAQELISLDSGQAEQLVNTITQERLTVRQVRTMVRQSKQFEYTFGDTVKSTRERDQERADKILRKCIATLRLSLTRFDDAIEYVPDDWLFREVLLAHRSKLSSQIDDLLSLRKRLTRLLAGNARAVAQKIPSPTR
jgi:ParB family chromosome partitioning protein